MKKMLFKNVNKKLVKKESPMFNLNNNIVKNYELTNRNISDFS